MKKTFALIFLVAAAAVAAEHHNRPLKSNAAFDRMKLLVGDWKADIPNMGAVTATYSIEDHFTATWNSVEGGKTMAVPFEFTRVR